MCNARRGWARKVWPLPDSRAAASAPSLVSRCFHKSQIPRPARPSSSFSRDRDGSPATPIALPLSPERSLTAQPITRGASAAANVPPVPDGRHSPTGEAARRGPARPAGTRGRAGPSPTGLEAGETAWERAAAPGPGTGTEAAGGCPGRRRRSGERAGPRPAAPWSREPRGGDGPPRSPAGRRRRRRAELRPPPGTRRYLPHAGAGGRAGRSGERGRRRGERAAWARPGSAPRVRGRE